MNSMLFRRLIYSTVLYDRSWPIALSGRDIISVARTGSGKTLGFLLPAFHALLNRPGGCKPRMGAGPYIVVLAPTRELACQINEEATKFGKAAGIRSTTVYGAFFLPRPVNMCPRLLHGTPLRAPLMLSAGNAVMVEGVSHHL